MRRKVAAEKINRKVAGRITAIINDVSDELLKKIPSGKEFRARKGDIINALNVQKVREMIIVTFLNAFKKLRNRILTNDREYFASEGFITGFEKVCFQMITNNSKFKTKDHAKTADGIKNIILYMQVCAQSDMNAPYNSIMGHLQKLIVLSDGYAKL